VRREDHLCFRIPERGILKQRRRLKDGHFTILTSVTNPANVGPVTVPAVYGRQPEPVFDN